MTTAEHTYEPRGYLPMDDATEYNGPHIVLGGNGAYANRGCEAIARSTVQLIRRELPTARFTMASQVGPQDQPDEQLPAVTHITLPVRPARLPPTAGRLRRRLHALRNKAEVAARNASGVPARSRALRSVLSTLTDASAILSVAGDAYRVGNGRRFYGQVAMDAEAIHLGVPVLVWPATLGPFPGGLARRFLARHFSRCDLVLCRDTESVELLSTMGVTSNVRLVADPAFCLDSEQPCIDLPADLRDHVGVNLAPLMAGPLRVPRDDLVDRSARVVVSIRNRTDRPILLVPHETGEQNPGNDEERFLLRVAEQAGILGCECSIVPGSLRCWQLKWVIGQLAAFAAVKTHATIASFSSCIPTLTFYRGVKSLSIPRMVYGDDAHIIRPGDFTPDVVGPAMSNLVDNRDRLRAALHARMPEIQAMSARSVEYLLEAIERS